MRTRMFTTFFIAACSAAALQIDIAAQERGQQPANLTEKQWLESKQAQAHVTTAMAIAKQDLLKETFA